MTISSISSLSVSSYQPDQASSNRQLFAQMAKAIRSGDLSGAQQAYAALTQSTAGGSQSNPNSPFSQALTQIGQALQSGNLGAAQQALASLGSQAQGPRGAHGHHHHHGGGGSAETSTSSLTVSVADGVGSDGSSTDPTQSGTSVNVTV